MTPKFIPELSRDLSGRALDIYEGRSGLPEAKRLAYIAAWKGEPPAAPPAAKSEPCTHRTPEPVRLVKCTGCGGNVHTKVYGCAVHGECTAGKRLDGVRGVCNCGSYRAPGEALLTLGAPARPRPPQARAALPPFADAVAWVPTAQLARDTTALGGILPADCSGVVGVPRSGMLPASILATHLHLPLGEIDTSGRLRWLASGSRGGGLLTAPAGSLVVVDDTVYGGNAMRRARQQLAGVRAVFAAVYVRPEAADVVDLCSRVLPAPHLLEWNVANNGPFCGFAADPATYGTGVATDLDGIICHDEFSGGPVGTPYIVPRKFPVRLIVTGRHARHRRTTEAALRGWGVRWDALAMLPDHVPLTTESAAAHKAEHYARSGHGFFMESCPDQAALIHAATGKRVICPRAEKVFT